MTIKESREPNHGFARHIHASQANQKGSYGTTEIKEKTSADGNARPKALLNTLYPFAMIGRRHGTFNEKDRFFPAH
jgi:hypothetical protein